MIAMNSIPLQAARLLDSGAVEQAVKLVSGAAQRGDPDALNQLALWHVYGQPLRRDFAMARLLFGRAGDAGHKPAAITHAVFVALGAGADPDWPAALSLLEAAARRDAKAARQLDLLMAMDINADGRPISLPQRDRRSTDPGIDVRQFLFSAEECQHVIALASPLLAPSIVVDSRTGRSTPNPIRTSCDAVLGPIQQDLVVHALNMRIAAATGTAVDRGEPLVVLRYEPGQQYRIHHDCLASESNQRDTTAIIYLNSDYEGGKTVFPTLDIAIKGGTGDALSFANTLPDGRADARSRHAGESVTAGSKWICTRWIRRTRFDPWGLRTPSPLIKS